MESERGFREALTRYDSSRNGRRDALIREPAVLGAGIADADGVPFAGRAAEYAMLREMGYRDLNLGRLFEGHLNALQLVARFGDEGRRARAAADARGGALFGVWNTQASDGVHLIAAGDELRLTGRKTFCSGAGRVTRALVTAAWPDGRSQMLVVPMDAVVTAIDRSTWEPLGMHASESFAVGFDGVVLASDAAVGEPGEYERAPWFAGGASRFLAVQTGSIERLRDELARWLAERGRADDSLQLMRIAECAVAAGSARQWVESCIDRWRDFDRAQVAADREAAAEPLLRTVDAARVAIERAALDVAERVERAVGARGLLEPHPFARLVRDLRMYLRQPAPDAALLRVGAAAVAHALRAGAVRSIEASPGAVTGEAPRTDRV